MDKVTGRTTYYSKSINQTLTLQQTPHCFEILGNFLEIVKPVRILEIGTAGGGTIQFIRDKLNDIGLSDTKIKSFEITEHKWYPAMRNSGIDVIIENIFSKSYLELKNTEVVKPFIQSDGTTIVMCDGGSKINEFKLLTPFLKIGDIIMAHDYIDTKENFLENYKDKIWDWREIGDEYISEICKKYNLYPFNQDLMDKIVWVCKIKK